MRHRIQVGIVVVLVAWMMWQQGELRALRALQRGDSKVVTKQVEVALELTKLVLDHEKRLQDLEPADVVSY